MSDELAPRKTHWMDFCPHGEELVTTPNVALLCNDSRGNQEGSCQRNERMWVDSYLVTEKSGDFSDGRGGTWVWGCSD